ncbi:MAG: flippase-like domain-containing protein [Deltaproteobacteria bacterium]|nr:flippase-like domain-containing protein [Deltaproteobacteria bacterium]
MGEKKRLILSLGIGLLVSGVALYVTFRHIPIQDLFGYLKTVNYWWVIPAVAVTLTGFVLRVVRWQLLLSPVKETPFWSAFHPLMIGFALNLLMPARVGEIARPAIFFKKEKVAFARVLATVGAERVFDVFTLLFFFAGVLATVKIDPQLDLTFGRYHLNRATLESIGMTTLKLCFVLLAGIIALSTRVSRRLIKRVILALPALLVFSGDEFRERVRDKVCLRLAKAVDHLAVGLDMLKSPGKVGRCLLLSFLVWILAGASHYIFTLGCPGVQVSFLEMCAVMVILCFFISLPSVPGFWGLWEAGGVFGLLIFGVPAKEAAGFTLANHVFQIGPVLIVGIVSSIITGVSLVHVPGRQDQEAGS